MRGTELQPFWVYVIAYLPLVLVVLGVAWELKRKR